MKKVLIVLMIFLVTFLFIGCYGRGEKVETSGSNWDSDVRKLFEVDGISVYRFEDGLNTVYFTNTTGKATCIRRDNTKVTECICNGEVKTENSEDQNNRAEE